MPPQSLISSSNGLYVPLISETSVAELSRWTCRTEKFAFYAASDAAIWTLVAFTVDRCVAVSFPLHKTKLRLVHSTQTELQFANSSSV